MADREQAKKLAKVDWRAAWACAQDIDDAWYRCQALAWVARFAPDGEIERIARTALKAAAAGHDSYQKLAATAWPIRALIERAAVGPAKAATIGALPLAKEIEHAGSRAEALFLLFQAVLPASISLWEPVFEAMLEIPKQPTHWRCRRALREAFLMVHERDPALAGARLSRVGDEKTRRQIEDRMARREIAAIRSFFW